MSDHQWLKLSEIAEELNCAYTTIRRLVTQGDLRAIRVGKLLRVKRTDLDKYIELHRKEGAHDYLI